MAILCERDGSGSGVPVWKDGCLGDHGKELAGGHRVSSCLASAGFFLHLHNMYVQDNTYNPLHLYNREHYSLRVSPRF